MKQSSQEWENIFQAISHPTIILDQNHEVIAANNATMEATGKSKKKLLGKKCYEIFHNADKPIDGCPMEKMITSGKKETLEVDMETLGGVYMVSCSPVLDETGKLEKVIHIATDITERKRTEIALIKSEERYRNIYENTPIGIYRTTPEGRILLANPTLLKMLGYDTFEELAQRDLEHEGYHPDYPRSGFKKEIEQKGQVLAIESAWQKKDRSMLHIREHAVAVRDKNGNTLFYEGTVEDITERKLAEQALKEREAHYRLLFDLSPSGIFLENDKGDILDANKAVSNTLGYEIAELLKMNVRDFASSKSKKKIDEHISEILSGGIKVHEVENIKKNGSRCFTELNETCVLLPNGEKGILCISNDITERKQTAQALRESEEKYRNLIQHSNDAIYLLYDRKFEIINDKFQQMFAVTLEEVNKPDFDFMNLVAPKSKTNIEKRFKRLASGEKLTPNYEFFAISKDGKEFEVEVSVSYLKYKQGTAVQGIIRDITKRKQSERTLRKWLMFEKMTVDISSRFIGIYDLDERINESLSNIGKFSEADRVYVFLINENGTEMDNTHEWCAENVTPQIENLKNIPLDMFPWWMDKLKKNEEIYITDVSKLPAEAAAEKQILESQDIKSLNVLPLFLDKGLIGFVGFDNVVKTGKWRAEDKTTLRIFSEILGTAFERTQKEKLIQNSLREKDVLLNEIHHRVRNNMNLITSLLELQARRIQNKQQAIEAFEESANRIYSMALIHKQLYESESYSQVEFKKFIETLVQRLFLSYNVKKQVVLDKKIMDVVLSIDRAIPLGLILNELISNALKHAFPENRKGNLFISLKPIKGDLWELVVEDDGLRFPKHFNFENPESLGMELVKILIDQIDGIVEFIRKKGNRFVVKFEIKK